LRDTRGPFRLAAQSPQRRETLQMPDEFVLNSLRHIDVARLGKE